MSAAYVGIDLAWSARNRTGLAVVDDAGALVASGVVVSDADLDAWLAAHAPQVRVVAVDAPLIVPNLTGQRLGETEVARAYSAYGAAPHSASRKFPYLDPPRAEELARRHGWSTDPSHRATAAVPSCIEVYPHPALVGLFRLGERILYKKGTDRRAGFDLLMTCLESVPELALDRNERWRALRAVVAEPSRGQLTAIEDEIDAVVCAHLAWLWAHRADELHVYGTHADGYIVAPPPPTHPPVRTARAGPGQPGHDDPGRLGGGRRHPTRQPRTAPGR